MAFVVDAGVYVFGCEAHRPCLVFASVGTDYVKVFASIVNSSTISKAAARPVINYHLDTKHSLAWIRRLLVHRCLLFSDCQVYLVFAIARHTTLIMTCAVCVIANGSDRYMQRCS